MAGGVDEAIGARVRRARLARRPKMTLADLAGDHLSISLVSKIERGQVSPSLATLGYLAARLGLPAASLLESSGMGGNLATASLLDRQVVRLNHAEACLALGDVGAALTLLDEAAFAEAGDWTRRRLMALRAMVLLAGERLDEAARAARSLEVAPGSAVEEWPSSRRGAPHAGDGDRGYQDRSGDKSVLTDAGSEADDALARARAAFVVGEVARRRGRDQAAVDGFRRCLRALGDDGRGIDLRAWALRSLAALHDDRGDVETARNLYRQSAALLVQASHPRQRAARWLRLGESLERAGDQAGANLAFARAGELAALLEVDAVRADVDARLGRLTWVRDAAT